MIKKPYPPKMVTVILLTAIAIFNSHAQGCDSLFYIQEDKFSDDRILRLVDPYVLYRAEDQGLAVDLTHYVGTGIYRLLFVVEHPSIGCIEKYAGITLVFRNGNKYPVTSAYPFNCDGIVTIDPKMWIKRFRDDLYASEVDAIRIGGVSGHADFHVEPDVAAGLLSLLQCFQRLTASK